MENNKTYLTGFKCSNCGNKINVEIPFGISLEFLYDEYKAFCPICGISNGNLKAKHKKYNEEKITLKTDIGDNGHLQNIDNHFKIEEIYPLIYTDIKIKKRINKRK
jgi:hypothetical protein